MTVDMCNHTSPLSAHHTCAEDGCLNALIGRKLAEIFGRIGGWLVVGLGFGGLVVCVPR
jgi:hypothetical protein